MNFLGKTIEEDGFTWLKNRNEIVQANWFYCYDGGGFTGIIPEFAPVQPEMVGKKAKDACAWEYFLKPIEDWVI